jgi:hypothetical protein
MASKSKTVKKLFLALAFSLPLNMCSGIDLSKLQQHIPSAHEDSTAIQKNNPLLLGVGVMLWYTIANTLFAAGKIYKRPQTLPDYVTSVYKTDTINIGGSPKPYPYLNPIISCLGLAAFVYFYNRFMSPPKRTGE